MSLEHINYKKVRKKSMNTTNNFDYNCTIKKNNLFENKNILNNINDITFSIEDLDKIKTLPSLLLKILISNNKALTFNDLLDTTKTEFYKLRKKDGSLYSTNMLKSIKSTLVCNNIFYEFKEFISNIKDLENNKNNTITKYWFNIELANNYVNSYKLKKLFNKNDIIQKNNKLPKKYTKRDNSTTKHKIRKSCLTKISNIKNDKCKYFNIENFDKYINGIKGIKNYYSIRQNNNIIKVFIYLFNLFKYIFLLTRIIKQQI